MGAVTFLILLTGFDLKPPGDDWDPVDSKDTTVQAKYQTFFAGTRPLVSAVVVLRRIRLGKYPDRALADWTNSLGKRLPEARLVDRAGKLAGSVCRVLLWETKQDRLTVHVLRRGKVAWLFEAHLRNGKDDADVIREIDHCRRSLKLAPPPPKSKPKSKPKSAPKSLPKPRTEIRLGSFWRLKAVKPAGFVRDPRAHDSLLLLKAARGQGSCEIRIWGNAKTRRSLDEVRAECLAQFRDTFPAPHRQILEARKRWKVRLGKKSHVLLLRGKRTVSEDVRWYLADCRNGRRYRVRIWITGPAAPWETALADFLDHFQPQNR